MAIHRSESDPTMGTERPRRQSEAYPDTRDFLDTFAKALTTGDARAIAALWETPAFVLGDGMARVVSSSQEVEEFFSHAKEQYNAQGIMEARAEILQLECLTERIVQVEARWPYVDQYGKEFGHETSTYTLMRDDSGQLRLRVAVMHGAVKSSH
jgi:hypothetical protein